MSKITVTIRGTVAEVAELFQKMGVNPIQQKKKTDHSFGKSSIDCSLDELIEDLGIVRPLTVHDLFSDSFKEMITKMEEANYLPTEAAFNIIDKINSELYFNSDPEDSEFFLERIGDLIDAFFTDDRKYEQLVESFCDC